MEDIQCWIFCAGLGLCSACWVNLPFVSVECGDEKD
jgi:hypothetical protein